MNFTGATFQVGRKWRLTDSRPTSSEYRRLQCVFVWARRLALAFREGSQSPIRRDPGETTLMPKRTTALKNVSVDKSAFDALLGALIASPPIRKDDLKPKRKALAKSRPRKSSR